MRALVTLFQLNDYLLPIIDASPESMRRVVVAIETLLQTFASAKKLPQTRLHDKLIPRQWPVFKQSNAGEMFRVAKQRMIIALQGELNKGLNEGLKSLYQALTEGCDFPSDMEVRLQKKMEAQFSCSALHERSFKGSQDLYMDFILAQEIYDIWGARFPLEEEEGPVEVDAGYQFLATRVVSTSLKFHGHDDALGSPLQRFTRKGSDPEQWGQLFIEATRKFASDQEGESLERSCYMAWFLFEALNEAGLKVRIESYFKNHFLVVIQPQKGGEKCVVDPLLNPEQAWYLEEYLEHMAPKISQPKTKQALSERFTCSMGGNSTLSYYGERFSEPAFSLTLTSDLVGACRSEVLESALRQIDLSPREDGVESITPPSSVNQSGPVKFSSALAFSQVACSVGRGKDPFHSLDALTWFG